MKTEHTQTCIRWTGYIDEDGYGRCSINGKWMGAHRVAYEKKHGPIPEGLVIDHLCRVRCCINPDHLEAVTSAENTRRGAQANKTHCIRGHELSGDNLRIAVSGGRECKTCQRARWRAYYSRKKSALQSPAPETKCPEHEDDDFRSWDNDEGAK